MIFSEQTIFIESNYLINKGLQFAQTKQGAARAHLLLSRRPSLIQLLSYTTFPFSAPCSSHNQHCLLHRPQLLLRSSPPVRVQPTPPMPPPTTSLYGKRPQWPLTTHPHTILPPPSPSTPHVGGSGIQPLSTPSLPFRPLLLVANLS